MTRSPNLASISYVRLLSGALLTAVWCVLWGEASLANVLSGAALATLFVAVGTENVPARSVRPILLAKFLGLVLVDLAKSTLAVAAEVLTKADHTLEAIVVVDTGNDPVEHPLLMVVAITITPGTGVVDTDPRTGAIYLHLLHSQKAGDVADHVRRLNRLANAALPLRKSAGPASRVPTSTSTSTSTSDASSSASPSSEVTP